MKNFLVNRRWAAAVAVGTALAVTGFIGLRAATVSGQNPPATIKTAPRSPEAAHRGYSSIVKKVTPAVVNISSSRVVKNDMQGTQGMQGVDPFFRQFFGNNFFNNIPKEQREKSLGSGVIVSPEGYILTNNHVVDHATDVEVTLKDKRTMKAKVIGTDPRVDIAVLKIEGSDFPYMVLGDSSKAEVGDIVLAIGDPFGVGQTVTSGIISATGRSLNNTIEQVEDFIQTDAPINPGNSGGALVDEDGHLIGINTAIISGNSGGNQGIGFAIPVNLARHDMDEILAHGKVQRGYLGILPEDLKPGLAKAFNAPDTNGALVGDVTANSPSSKAGLQKGDIILGVNGETIADANALRLKIGTMDPGTQVNLKVLREGKTMQIPVTLGEFPSNEQQASNNAPGQNDALDGVTVENLDPDTAQQLNLPSSTKGVVVEQVAPDSRASESGLQSGDVILQVNHKPVLTVDAFKREMNETTKDKPVLLLINRQGNTLFLAI